MGKVHGSLARAGKVKSQTPKVEPQEKKKKVCGRAKKRIIYNRRFVNVRRNRYRIAGETMLIFRFGSGHYSSRWKAKNEPFVVLTQTPTDQRLMPCLSLPLLALSPHRFRNLANHEGKSGS